MTTSHAKYEGGFCPNDCGERIHTGDLVTWDGDELVHATCAPRLELTPTEIVCPDCWLTKPCKCDE